MLNFDSVIFTDEMDDLLLDYDNHVESLFWMWLTGSQRLLSSESKAVVRLRTAEERRLGLDSELVEIYEEAVETISQDEIAALTKIIDKFKRLDLMDMLSTLSGVGVSFTSETKGEKTLSSNVSSGKGLDRVTFSNGTRGYK